MVERFAGDRPRRRRAHGRARRAPAVRPHRGARLPLPRLLRRRRPGDPASSPRSATHAFAERYAAVTDGCKRRRAPGSRASCALIDELGLAGFFLLHHEVLELARECALEVRGRDSPRHVPAAGAGAGQLGRLDRLLPDRPLPRRPGRERPLARPLPQPRARVGAGHRPRLPARHPREAHRPRHRALRQRARRARRELRHLPLARRDPRRRQGARAAARRARAARARHRRLERRTGRRGGRAGSPTPTGSSSRSAGARSSSSPRRSPACRATSRSTRAGW